MQSGKAWREPLRWQPQYPGLQPVMAKAIPASLLTTVFTSRNAADSAKADRLKQRQSILLPKRMVIHVADLPRPLAAGRLIALPEMPRPD